MDEAVFFFDGEDKRAVCIDAIGSIDADTAWDVDDICGVSTDNAVNVDGVCGASTGNAVDAGNSLNVDGNKFASWLCIPSILDVFAGNAVNVDGVCSVSTGNDFEVLATILISCLDNLNYMKG